MSLKISFLPSVFFIFCSCIDRVQPKVIAKSEVESKPLIQAEELRRPVGETGYAIIDFIPNKAYQKRHFPITIETEIFE